MTESVKLSEKRATAQATWAATDIFLLTTAADESVAMALSNLVGKVPATGLAVGAAGAADSVLVDVRTDEAAGTTKLWWDDSEDAFVLTKGLQVAAGQILGAVGSAAAPTFCFTGEKDCGMYRIAAGQVGLACDGALRLGVTANATSLYGAASETTLGAELVLNPTFATGPFTNWTAGAGWSSSSGAAHATGNTATLVSDAITIENAAYYQLVVTITGTPASTVVMSLTNATGYTPWTAFGTTLTTSFKASSTSTVITITPNTLFDGTIASISLKKITAASAVALAIKNADNSISGFAVRAGGTGKYNLFVGDYTGVQNTTGNKNVALGYYALNAVTTGYRNVAIGDTPMSACTNGADNIAIGGWRCMHANLTGSGNIGLGSSALSGILGSSNSIGIGSGAGAATSGLTPVTAADSSIYIGLNTRPAAATGDLNSIVMGTSAIGLGANTTVIGADATHLITQLGGALQLTNTAAAPTNGANKAHLYCADQAAGNACMFTKTENGQIIKLFSGAAVTAAAGGATVDAEARTAINTVITRLIANGLLLAA